MNQSDITVRQAKILLRTIEPAALYVERLHRRLQKNGIFSTDPYYIRVQKAAESMHCLRIWTFYMTVAQGVGADVRKLE
jgi:hypothetical protein